MSSITQALSSFQFPSHPATWSCETKGTYNTQYDRKKQFMAYHTCCKLIRGFSQVLGFWLQPRRPYYVNSHSIFSFQFENFTVWPIGIILKCWQNHNWALFSAAIKKGVPQNVLPLTQVLVDPWWSQMRTKASSSDLFNVLTAPAATHWAWCWCRPTTFSGDLCLWLD